MKVLVGLILFVALCGGAVLWMNNEMYKDQGFAVPVAFGDPTEDQILLHFQVDRSQIAEMPKRDHNLNPLWKLWLEEHWKLYDSMNEEVNLSKLGSSHLIKGRDAGSGDFFVGAMLYKGENYRLVYKPVLAEPKTLTLRFTAAEDSTRVTRPLITPDK